MLVNIDEPDPIAALRKDMRDTVSHLSRSNYGNVLHSMNVSGAKVFIWRLVVFLLLPKINNVKRVITEQ
jgi:hypothetical protein